MSENTTEIMMLSHEETAHHEAGHVVAAFVLGASRFESVEIFEHGGGHSFPRFDGFSGSVQEAARRAVIVGVAGGVAQGRYLELRDGMPREAAYEHSLKFCAPDMQAVYNALLVGGPSLDAAIGAEVRDLIVTHWAYIEKLAHKLLEKHRLTNEDVIPLLLPIRRTTNDGPPG